MKNEPWHPDPERLKTWERVVREQRERERERRHEWCGMLCRGPWCDCQKKWPRPAEDVRRR